MYVYVIKCLNKSNVVSKTNDITITIFLTSQLEEKRPLFFRNLFQRTHHRCNHHLPQCLRQQGTTVFCEDGSIGTQVSQALIPFLTSTLSRHNEVTLSSLPRLDGKVALLTRVNIGIGKVITQFLAHQGTKVYTALVTSTYRRTFRRRRQTIQLPSLPLSQQSQRSHRRDPQEEPDADLNFLAYEPSSLCAVHSTALEFMKLDIPLDILVLHAGAIVGKPQGNKDGLE